MANMGKMDDVLAMIRAAGTTPTPKAPRTEKEIFAAMAAAGRAEMARSGVTLARPVEPEPAYEPPVDTRMPLLPVTLTPYVSMPYDYTREEVRQQMDFGPDDYASDESYADDVERHWQREIIRRGANGTRVAAALGVHVDQGLEPAVACTACERPDPAMMCDVTLHEVRARCEAGCTPEAMGRGLTARVAEYERYHRAAAQNEAASALAARLDIATVLGSEDRQEWVIPGFIAADGLTMMGGTSGDGKTFEAMHAGICAALGRPWFGRTVAPTRTLLMLLEGATPDHTRRIRLLAAGLDATLADLNGKLDVYPQSLGFRSDDPSTMGNLVNMIKTLGHKFVIIDNLTNARANTDENSASNLSAALQPLADLAHNHKVGILLIHHANAKGELRGSSAIRQHADSVFEMTRSNAKNTSPITLKRTKDRYGTSLDEIRFRFLDRADLTTGRTGAIIAAALADYQPDPDDLVREEEPEEDAPPPPVDMPITSQFADLLALLPASSEAIYKHLGGSRNRTVKIRNQLERHGAIVLKGREWHKV